MKVLTSPFRNPFINLALEDFFLRGGADLPILLFYVNRPSVILGRFQNPWLETNLSYLVEHDIWLVRRQSGGGCVFHDEGNLNFSFITPSGALDRTKHAELLKEAFKKADIHLTISPRNDLWLNDMDGTPKKISGSAYKQTKEASFHHGTFLVSSDLDKLEQSLKHTFLPKMSKSISSVRSKVISLQKIHPGVEINDVIELISHFLKTIPFELTGEYLSHPAVQDSFQKLTGWDWLWGETPLFELENGLVVRKGIIQTNGKKFDREAMKNELEHVEMERFFPDFSEQHRLSNQIF
jgi:lipoate-protein ligase A